MSTPVPETGQQTAEETQHDENAAFEPITSQEQLDKLISSRIARERSKYADYQDLQEKAKRFDELEEANKSELQKAQDALAAETKARTAAQVELLRIQVAGEKGLDAKTAAYLQGSTREELEASADGLAALIGAKPRVQPDPTQGREQYPGNTTHSGDWLREKITSN